MMNDPDRFRQDNSPYERPNFPYRCGRAVLWGKPCWRGPTVEGTCGGVSECRPFFSNGRWECRRPPQAGGPCADGPLPDGRCSNRHPPCRPRRSLRVHRGRLTLLAVGLVLAGIAALAIPNGETSRASSLSPGTISGAHANFTSETGCGTCHEPHDQGAVGWLKAAWSPNSISNRCVECHKFAGPHDAAHNRVAAVDKAPATTCVMCHTEHKGANASLVKIADAQCNSCHTVKFESFSKGHPEFSERYPTRKRTEIAFNHVSHLNQHFNDPRVSDRAPPERCISCHDVSAAGRNVPVRPFEETCAACHADQIPGRDLVLFTFPELPDDPFDKSAVVAACGPSAVAREEAQGLVASLSEKVQALEASPGVSARDVLAQLRTDLSALRARMGIDARNGAETEEYMSVSLEYLTPIGAFLLGVEDAEDPAAYAEAVRDIVTGMIEDGDEALRAMLESRNLDGRGLLAGLPPELVRAAACAWAHNQEYEPPAEAAFGGWIAEYLTLKYRPTRHGDAVVKAWLDLAAAGENGVTDPMRAALLSPTGGAGACAKCHGVSYADPQNQDRLKVEWNASGKNEKPQVDYSHVPHLNLLGPGSTCNTCHKIDEKAPFAAAFEQHDPHTYASNFKPLEKAACTACHAERQVRQECTLCHDYHTGPGFQRRMTFTAGTEVGK